MDFVSAFNDDDDEATWLNELVAYSDHTALQRLHWLPVRFRIN